MSDDLPQITDERLGEMIINAIMYSHLFEPECPECVIRDLCEYKAKTVFAAPAEKRRRPT